MSDQQRVAVVTGANKGIGLEVSRILGRVPGIVCVMGCRNEQAPCKSLLTIRLKYKCQKNSNLLRHWAAGSGCSTGARARGLQRHFRANRHQRQGNQPYTCLAKRSPFLEYGRPISSYIFDVLQAMRRQVSTTSPHICRPHTAAWTF